MDPLKAKLTGVLALVCCTAAACGGKVLASESIQSTGEGVACLPTSTTTRLSVSSSGAQGNQNSVAPTLSGDGRFLAVGSNDEVLHLAPEVSAASLLESATRVGAEALGYGRSFGTIARPATIGIPIVSK